MGARGRFCCKARTRQTGIRYWAATFNRILVATVTPTVTAPWFLRNQRLRPLIIPHPAAATETASPTITRCTNSIGVCCYWRTVALRPLPLRPLPRRPGRPLQTPIEGPDYGVLSGTTQRIESRLYIELDRNSNVGHHAFAWQTSDTDFAGRSVAAG